MRILLTGATGFLGNNLLRELGRRGDDVVAVVRKMDGVPALEGLAFEPALLDLAKAGDLERSLPPFDLCIHAAALIQIGWSRLDEARAVNVTATRQLARVCRRRSARLIHVSTVNTLACSRRSELADESRREPGCPPICYVVTKREAEQAVADEIAQGLDAVTVHPSFLLGRWDWRPSSAEMMISIARQRPPFAPGGGTNAVDVRDVVAGILLAAASAPAGSHYVLGGENVSYFDLWTRMARVVGVRGPRFRLPDWLAIGGGRAGDLWGKLRRHEGPLNSGAARMGQLFHYYSSASAEAALGYRPRPIDDAIAETARWCQERGWIRMPAAK